MIFLFTTFFFVVVNSFGENVNLIFPIRKGVNVNEWLEKKSLDSLRLDTLVSYGKLDTLHYLEFDHVRIPVSEEILFDDTLGYRQNVWSVLLDRIDYCISHNIKVIIDLHVSRVHKFAQEKNSLFTSDSSKIHFFNVWKRLQNVFEKYSTSDLAYECLNEPAAPDKKHYLWNQVLREWISLIRVTEKKRVLFIGSNRGNQLWTAKYLDLPLGDPYLVITFHYYRPSEFTHYKASWGRHQYYDGPINYPGVVLKKEDYKLLPDSLKSKFKNSLEIFNENRMDEDFQKALNYLKHYNLPINVGEFGCLRNVPNTMRYKWFNDLVGVFKKHGISYTIWGMNGAGFGIWDGNRVLDEEMLKQIK